MLERRAGELDSGALDPGEAPSVKRESAGRTAARVVTAASARCRSALPLLRHTAAISPAILPAAASNASQLDGRTDAGGGADAMLVLVLVGTLMLALVALAAAVTRRKAKAASARARAPVSRGAGVGQRGRMA
jgi:hypothetical protein